MFPFNYSVATPLAGGTGTGAPPAPPSQDSDSDDPTVYRGNNHKLQFHGNERTMNLNPLILTNIQGSPYFKVELFGVKTFHEVVDEIYYKVDHLEPWATGSRKTAGRSQTGMCGGVRGVSAGGIVSSAYCLLYKLYTLKLTKKQVMSLINHCDSPYIRGLGFMFLRYTLPPGSLWDWFEPYLEDEEEIDVKAGGGKSMTIGEMCRLMLTRLEWFDTRFPRIAVNIEKIIRGQLEERAASNRQYQGLASAGQGQQQFRKEEPKTEVVKEVERDKGGFSVRRERSKSRSREVERRHSREKDKDRKRSDRDRDRKKSRSRSRERHKKSHKRSRSRERHRDRSRDRHHHKDKRDRDRDYSEELRKFRDDSTKYKKHSRRSRSRSRSR